jgi:hypothetical protein
MKHLITITVMLAIALCASCDKKNDKGSDDDNNTPPAVVPTPTPTTAKKYVVGNFYNENGIKGIIYKIIDEDSLHGMIVSLDETNCTWAIDSVTELVKTEATDEFNGMTNMEKIRLLGIDKYPAFKWCDDKNTNGVTGWYLPTSYELIDIYDSYINTAISFADSLKMNEGTDFSSVVYWGSNEIFPPNLPVNAQSVNFLNGEMITTAKNTKHAVRAVRAF